MVLSVTTPFSQLRCGSRRVGQAADVNHRGRFRILTVSHQFFLKFSRDDVSENLELSCACPLCAETWHLFAQTPD
jgi:hypothetical protein